MTPIGSRLLGFGGLELYNLAVHRWQILDPFSGSDASWVDRAVGGDVVDLAARRADVV